MGKCPNLRSGFQLAGSLAQPVRGCIARTLQADDLCEALTEDLPLV